MGDQAAPTQVRETGEECHRGRQARGDQGGINCVEMLKVGG